MCCFEKSWGRLAKIMLALLVKAKILNLCPWDTNVPNVKCPVFIDISCQLLGDLFIVSGTREQVCSCMNRLFKCPNWFICRHPWTEVQSKENGVSVKIETNSQGNVWCKPSLLSLLWWLSLSGGSVPTLRRLCLHSLPLFWLPWHKAQHLMWPFSRYVVNKEKIIYCVVAVISVVTHRRS